MISSTSNSSGTATQTVAGSCAVAIPINSTAKPAKPTTTATLAPNTGTTEEWSAFTALVLGQIRVAALRAKIIANEIEATATALSGAMISPEAALLILHEIALSPVEASS